MLLPQFSLRSTLLGLTGCAVFFLIVGQAVRGEPWAIVVAVAGASVVVLLAGHAFLYLLVAGLTRLVGAQPLPARTLQGGLQESTDRQSPPELGDTISDGDTIGSDEAADGQEASGVS